MGFECPAESLHTDCSRHPKFNHWFGENTKINAVGVASLYG